MIGAGDETRTRDINLGKVALYQLSYTREERYDQPLDGKRQWMISDQGGSEFSEIDNWATRSQRSSLGLEGYCQGRNLGDRLCGTEV
jgi:hypothetical protein